MVGKFYLNQAPSLPSKKKVMKQLRPPSPALHWRDAKMNKVLLLPGHGTIDWFQIRKGVHQGYHPTYLT